MDGKTEVKAQATEAPPTEVPSPDVREHTKDGLFVHGSGMVVNGSQHLSNNSGPQFQNVRGNVSLNFNDLFKVIICNLEGKDNKIQEYFNNNPSHTSRNMKDAFVLGCFLGEKPRSLDDVRGFVPSPPSEVDDEGRGAHPWKRYFDNFHAAPISGFSSMYGFSFTSGGLM
jgi:hypothetical protein